MMKKLLLIVAIFMSFAFTTKAQLTECAKKMREGKFTYEGKQYELEITRTKHKQVEVWNNGKSKLVLKIEWISDTEYWLTFKRMVNTGNNNIKKGDIIKTKIISCDGNKYYCETRGDNVPYTDCTIIKLE